jgi:hypothetical protein
LKLRTTDATCVTSRVPRVNPSSHHRQEQSFRRRVPDLRVPAVIRFLSAKWFELKRDYLKELVLPLEGHEREGGRCAGENTGTVTPEEAAVHRVCF